MTRRWSLHHVILYCGAGTLLALIIPLTWYLAQSQVDAIERILEKKGQGLGATLAEQIAEPLLLEHSIDVHFALNRTLKVDADLLYLIVFDRSGKIVGDTFPGTAPASLVAVLQGTEGPVRRFHTNGVPALDLEIPLMNGELGALHLGLSRERVATAHDRLLWAICGAFALSLAVLFLGAQLVAFWVNRPLRALEEAVARFPAQRPDFVAAVKPAVRELHFLALGFSHMADRIASLERQQEEVQDGLKHVERLAVLGVFTAGMAHEVRNPLDGILECVRLLDTHPERLPKYLPMLREGLMRIEQVLRHLLAFGRAESTLTLEDRPIAEAIDAVALMVKMSPRARRSEIHWPPDRLHCCRYDLRALTQALVNVVLNALDAVAQRPDPQVCVTTEAAQDIMEIIVADNGPGVDPAMRERIFEPFYTTRPDGQGTGLGLPIARHLVEEMGGVMEVRNAPPRSRRRRLRRAPAAGDLRGGVNGWIDVPRYSSSMTSL